MSNSKQLYSVLKKLGLKYTVGITTWPRECSFFNPLIKSKWICGTPYNSGQGNIDYNNYAYGETALQAAEGALELKNKTFHAKSTCKKQLKFNFEVGDE